MLYNGIYTAFKVVTEVHADRREYRQFQSVPKRSALLNRRSNRVASKARAAGLARDTRDTPGRGLGYQDDQAWRTVAGGADSWTMEAASGVITSS